MTYFYLIRHAQSTWNAEGRMQGHADPPLDALGEKQILALAQALSAKTIHALYSSPSQRAKRTAEAVASQHSLTLNFDNRLMERNLGDWTGLTGSEADDLYPEIRAGGDWRLVGPPGGESLPELIARAAAVFSEIVLKHPTDRVAVVSHGGLLNAYLMHLLGLPADNSIHFHFGNTAIARLRLENKQVHILSLGDEKHLDAMRAL